MRASRPRPMLEVGEHHGLGHKFIGSTPDPVSVTMTECTVTGAPEAIRKSAWLFSPSATAASGRSTVTVFQVPVFVLLMFAMPV